VNSNELYHYGVKGQKWGVRRYQNKDGSLTPAGKKRDKYDGKLISVGQAKGRAYKAETEARRNAFKELNSSDKRHTKHQYAVAAIKSGVKARKESIAADKTHNKQVRRQRAETIEQFKQKRSDISKNRTLGSKIATNMLAGPYANRTYNSIIAAGHSKTRARAETAATTILGGPVGHIMMSAIVAGDYAKRTNRT
jgi:hypothetical protein